jgi:hypothetical protein
MSTTYAVSLLSCPNASRNRLWEMSPTLRSNRTSQGANKPFLTQPSATQSTELSLNIMKLSPSLSLDPLTTEPNRSHLTLENYSLAAPTPVTDNPAVFHFHPGTRNDHHPPADQSAHSWPPSYQAMNSHPGQHGNMDLAAIFHATASYNPETRTEQEAMLDAAIFLSVAESAIRRATRASTPPECWGCHGI